MKPGSVVANVWAAGIAASASRLCKNEQGTVILATTGVIMGENAGGVGKNPSASGERKVRLQYEMGVRRTENASAIRNWQGACCSSFGTFDRHPDSPPENIPIGCPVRRRGLEPNLSGFTQSGRKVQVRFSSPRRQVKGRGKEKSGRMVSPGNASCGRVERITGRSRQTNGVTGPDGG